MVGGSFQDSSKVLNEDIPIEKKPKGKAKSRKPNAKNASMRYSHVFDGIAPSIQVYSPSPPQYLRRSMNGTSGNMRLSSVGGRHSKVRHSRAGSLTSKQK